MDKKLSPNEVKNQQNNNKSTTLEKTSAASVDVWSAAVSDLAASTSTSPPPPPPPPLPTTLRSSTAAASANTREDDSIKNKEKRQSRSRQKSAITSSTTSSTSTTTTKDQKSRHRQHGVKRLRDSKGHDKSSKINADSSDDDDNYNDDAAAVAAMDGLDHRDTKDNSKQQSQQNNNSNNNDSENNQQLLPGSYAVEGVDGSTHFDILDDDYDNAEPNPRQQKIKKDPSTFVVVAEIANDENLIRETENRVKKELIVNATHAEIVDNEEQNNEQQKRKFILCGIVACLVIIGIVVGVTVGTTNNNQPAAINFVDTTASPTTSFAPSFYPTNKPSDMPSATPTNKPSSKPSQRPSLRPSSLPSAPPTIAPTNPNNEQCKDAISLNTARFVSGDLAFTQMDVTDLECIRNGGGGGATALRYGRPRWYSFAGSSDNIALRLCTSLDSPIGTYIVDTCADGSFCEGLSDFFFYEQPNFSSDCSRQTLIIIPFTLPGLTYRIMLYIPFNYIANTVPPLPSLFPSIEDSENAILSENTEYTLELTQSIYYCEGAFDILLISPIPNGLNFVGTSFSARIQSEGQCGTASNENHPGVWYRILGSGDIVTYSTCGSSTEHQIAVYESDDIGTCANSKCIVGSNNGCEASVTWYARNLKTYFVLVSSATEIGGSFTLTPVSATPAVFDCIGAIEIDPFTFDSGAVFGYEYEDFVQVYDSRTCLSINISPDADHGVWWKFQGFNGTLEVASCIDDVVHSLGLSVFETDNNDNNINNCDEIKCVTSLAGCTHGEFNDSVSFITDPTKTYYIRAHGEYSLRPRLYSFAVVSVEPPLQPTLPPPPLPPPFP